MLKKSKNIVLVPCYKEIKTIEKILNIILKEERNND